jgi:hypothetical protein
MLSERHEHHRKGGTEHINGTKATYFFKQLHIDWCEKEQMLFGTETFNFCNVMHTDENVDVR